ncbi:unnamed protein product [Schistosoma turkestanicum]|nr:unnamed protein product [Schistosoma turkestanicum]
MDSQNNQFNIENITELIKQSNENIKAFKFIQEKFSNPLSTNEFIDFLQIITNNLHELTANNLKKLLFDNVNPFHWMILNNSTINMYIINLYVTSITYFPNFLHELCEFYVTQVFYLKHSIEQQQPLNTEHFNNFTHIALEFFNCLCQNLPQSITILVELLIKRFPNWRKSMKELIWSTYNLLFLLSNSKAVKLFTDNQICDLLSVILMCIIDLELNPDGVQCENVLGLFENTSLYTIFEKFDKTLFETNVSVLFNAIIIQQSNNNHSNHDKNWLKLELICWLLISYISSICKEEEKEETNGKFNWNLLCAIFRRIRDLFTEHIIPVNVHLVGYPMICFYMCSLRGGLVINFIDYLWNTIIKDQHRDEESRLMALSYLCFFVIHGKFCFIDLIIELMHDMCTWCIDYTYRNRRLFTNSSHSSSSSSSSSLVSLLSSAENKLYYAICNVLIYLFVQLHSELLNDQYYQQCHRLPIAQICLSPFKPFMNMPVELRQIFFQIISTYHLSWSLMIGLTQSINQPAPSIGDNQKSISVEMIQSFAIIPSKFISVPKNKCNLSLSLSIFNHLFRSIQLGERFIDHQSEQQQLDMSVNHRITSTSISPSLTSVPHGKHKTESDIDENSISDESIVKVTKKNKTA